MEKKHIICFGDSNTHGYCAETDGRFDENTRWTCLLQAKLGDEYLILEEGLGAPPVLTIPLMRDSAGWTIFLPVCRHMNRLIC